MHRCTVCTEGAGPYLEDSKVKSEAKLYENPGKQVHETDLPNCLALNCLRTETDLFFRQLKKIRASNFSDM